MLYVKLILNPVASKMPVLVVQSVASLTDDPGVVSLIPNQPHPFVETDHEIFSMVILFLLFIQEGLLSVTREAMCIEYWLTA